MRFWTWQALVAEPRLTYNAALRIDLEGVHGMVAGEGQPGHDDLGRPVGATALRARRSARCDRSFPRTARRCRARCRAAGIAALGIAPKRTFTSARPSPVVSWRATRNPPGGGVSLP